MEANKSTISLSIIVPVLNEARQLPSFLQHLMLWKSKGCEVLLVDGGSTDDTVSMVREMGLSIMAAKCGRANQMNAGAATTKGQMLLFLHADTYLPDKANQIIHHALTNKRHAWGRFNVCITGASQVLPIIATLMNIRSSITGIATGDQAMFMTRTAFDEVKGFPVLPLMEDIALSVELKKISAPICLKCKVTTSGRRWEKKGVLRTVLLMWRLRFAYWRGVPAYRLAEMYR